jgi:hypothetical protein
VDSVRPMRYRNVTMTRRRFRCQYNVTAAAAYLDSDEGRVAGYGERNATRGSTRAAFSAGAMHATRTMADSSRATAR